MTATIYDRSKTIVAAMDRSYRKSGNIVGWVEERNPTKLKAHDVGVPNAQPNRHY